LAASLLILSLAGATPARGASMVFVKKGDVWMARADGKGQVAITRNGTPGRPYFSPSISDNGTIVALRSIYLHSFRPSGRKIVKARQFAINPSPTLSSEPFSLDLSPNGRVVAVHNGFYSTYYDPRRSEERPTLAFQYTDFTDFRKVKEIGNTDTFYDYGSPAWIDSKRVLTHAFDIFHAQVLVARVGKETRGKDFFRDPARDPDTGTNAWHIVDAEMARSGAKWAAVRRPVRGDSFDLGLASLQIYRTGNPSTASTPLCAIGPGRRIDWDGDPSWSPDGKTLFWWERGRGIYSTKITSAPGCGLRPKLIVRGGLSPDLSRAKAPRRG
jgi:hypothetical protein